MSKKLETVTKKRTNVKAELFLETAWKAKSEGLGHTAIAEMLGMAKTTVATRLSSLRRHGNIVVPNFPRGGGKSGPRLDVEALNAIAKRYQAQNV